MAKKKRKNKPVIDTSTEQEAAFVQVENPLDLEQDEIQSELTTTSDEDGLIEPVEDLGIPHDFKEEIKEEPKPKKKPVTTLEDNRAKTLKVYLFKNSDTVINIAGQNYTDADLNEKTVATLRNIIPNFDKYLK